MKFNRVHHAVAVEPVVSSARLKDRIGTVAQVYAVEVLWDLADNVQIVGGDLSRDRREDSAQKRILAGIDLDWDFALDFHHDWPRRGLRSLQFCTSEKTRNGQFIP